MREMGGMADFSQFNGRATEYYVQFLRHLRQVVLVRERSPKGRVLEVSAGEVVENHAHRTLVSLQELGAIKANFVTGGWGLCSEH